MFGIGVPFDSRTASKIETHLRSANPRWTLTFHTARRGHDWAPKGGKPVRRFTHVFTTTIGTPMDERKVNVEFKPALRKTGLSPKRFHDLRHTAASLLLAQGVHPRTVMETLGHSQISLTLNTYSHVMPTVLRDAADKMQALLGR